MLLITLEERIDPVKKRYDVYQTVQARVKFVKTVRFFKSKIKAKALVELEANANDILIPMIKACLTCDDPNSAFE